jgi:hypothetical protein
MTSISSLNYTVVVSYSGDFTDTKSDFVGYTCILFYAGSDYAKTRHAKGGMRLIHYA